MPNVLDPDTRIKQVMAEVLDIDPMLIDDNYSREETSTWDSLNHLRLITALEEALGVKFTMQEVEEMRCYGQIRERVAAHLQAR
jgi:acyl carrier protein